MPLPILQDTQAPMNAFVDNENLAGMVGKAGLVMAAPVKPSAGVRPRTILGELCKNITDAEDARSRVGSVRIGDLVSPAPGAGASAFSYSTARIGVDIPDVDTEDNPQLVSCYVKDIYKYLLEVEERMPVVASYMDGYKVRPTMRSILVDWMIGVHGRFKLLQETLYMTVAVMDRYLQADPSVTRHELQLIGLASMFVSAKFEEMFAPEIHDFVYMSDKAYDKKDILRMEWKILRALDFQLGRPLPLHFLRRYTKIASHVSDDVDVLHHTLSKYLMELTLPEYDFCHYQPSLLAAASLCLSLKLLHEGERPVEEMWNQALEFYSGYDFKQLEPVIERLCSLIIKSESSKFQAVRKKYASSRFYNISATPQLRSAFVNTLAKSALRN